MIMEQLPTIPPGEDFDRQVLYRSWMASMPSTTVPEGFDASVVKRARKGAMSHWWGIAVIAVFLAVVGVTTLLQDDTSVVQVTSVPLSPLPTVDLYDLQPVPVVEDERFNVDRTVQPTRRTAPAPYGVAGH